MNKIQYLCTATLLYLTQPAMADVIHFNNGDIVSGTITKITSDNLTFIPQFGGDKEFTVTQSDIKSFETEKTVTIETNNDIIISGIISSNNNQFTIKNDLISQPKTMPLTEVKEAYVGKPKDRYALKTSGFIRGGLNIVSGNSDTKDYDFSGRFSGETGKSRITLNAEYGFSEDDTTTTRDRTLGGIKYDYFVADNVYAFTNSDFERDKFQELNLRTALGAGLGYQFYKGDDLNLNVETGPNFVNEDYTLSTRDNNYAALRWALNYDQKLTDIFSIYHNHRIIQSVSASDEIVANARTGVNIPLYNFVQAGFEWRLDWNNNPISGNDSLDQGYIATLGYVF